MSKTTATNQKTTILAAIAPGSGETPMEGKTLAKTSFTLPSESKSTAECVTKDPSNPADDDGDGIPLKVTYTLACDNAVSDSGKLTYSGNYTFEDKNDSASDPLADYGGFKGNADFSLVTSFDYSGKTASIEAENKAEFDLTRTDATYTYTGKDISTVSASGVGSESGEYSMGGNYSYKWIGTNATEPFKDGTAELNGFYRFMVAGESEVESITLKITSQNLTYSQTKNCPYFYDTGTITAEDEDGNKLVWTYNCNSPSAKYNEEAL
jgi:hypothetical protein